MNLVFWAHIFSCWFMVGIIWLVQLLVYPFFKYIGEKEFSFLHQFHTHRITWIVGPVMILEIVTALILFSQRLDLLFLMNLVSVFIIWVLTAVVNIPSHNRLQFLSEKTKRQLVLWNWPRTLVWTARAVFVFYLVSKYTQVKI